MAIFSKTVGDKICSKVSVLLDPSKKYFHRPPVLVQGADGQRWHVELIGQEHQCFPGIGVFEANTTQMFWVILFWIEAIERDSLIAHQARRLVHRPGVDPVCIHIPFRASDKEAAALMQSKEAFEIDVSAIHHVVCAGLRYQ